MPDNRNLILAVILSIGVFVAWHFLFERPRQLALTAQREAQMALEAANAPTGVPDAALAPAPPAGTIPGGVQAAQLAIPTRSDILTNAPRVAIETPKLKGSLSLAGARIDDLKLIAYREKIDPDSPAIVLLNPKGDKSSYYAEFGWTAGADLAAQLPGPDTVWTLVEGTTLTPDAPVSLRYESTNPQTGGSLVFTRKIAVDRDYLFTITDRVENKSADGASLYPYGRIARLGTPHIADLWLLFEGLIGVLDGHLEEVKYAQIVKDGRVEHKTTGGWLGITDKYWLTALMPPQDEPITTSFNHAKIGGADLYQTDYLMAARVAAPNASVEVTSHLFAGAKEFDAINRYESERNVALFDRAIDWGWFYFLTKPIFWSLDKLYAQVGNFGIAILILTVIMKALFFPLANRAYESMTKMKKIQPEMQKIQEKYKDDRTKMQQEIMAMYSREKVNPISGCLPMLLQIPVFFSLYKVLYVSIEMRHAPFYGWIHDLSAPDPTSVFTLFGLIPFTPPSFLMIGIWPLLMGLSYFVIQKLQPPPGDPTQEKIFLMMPVVMTFTMGQVPSGLAIYWTWNNLLSLIQQIIIMRRMGVPVELFRRRAPAAAK